MASMSSRTPGILCAARLSRMTVWPGLQPGAEHLLPIGQKDIASGGRFHGPAGEHALGGHRPQQREGAPVPGRSALANALSTPGAAIAPGHLGRHAALVQKHQPLRIQTAHRLPPRRAALPVLRGVLLLSVERFFLSRKGIRSSTRHRCWTLNQTPSAFHSPCCNSASVRSGCSRSRLRHRAATSAVRRQRGPCRCSTRSICPVRRRCEEIFQAHGLLTPNRSASSRKLPSPRAYASKSFRRKSFEYAFAIRFASLRFATNYYTPSGDSL